MDEALALPEPKIDLVEFLFIGVALAILSLANLIPFVGDITTVIAGAGMFIYLYYKGLWGTSTIATNAVGYLAGLIPVVQALPTQLVAWIITFIIDRSPKLEAVTEKVGALENVAEGGGGAGGVEGAAATEGEAAAAAGGAGATTATAAEAGEGAGAAAGAEGAAAGPEAGATAAGGETGAAVEEGGGAQAGTAEAEAPTTESAPREEVPPEALGEQPEPMEKLQKELVEETPGKQTGAPAEEEEAPASRETEAERQAREAKERTEANAEKAKRYRPQEEGENENPEEEEANDGQGEEEEEEDGEGTDAAL